MIRLAAVFVLVSYLSVSTVFASPETVKLASNSWQNLSREQKDYFSVKGVSVQDMGFVDLRDPTSHEDNKERGRGWAWNFGIGLGTVIAIADGLVALGTKAWAIVEAGRATAQTEFVAPISVLPKTAAEPAADFELMDSWSAPKARKYHVEFKNWRNAVVVTMDYLVHFQHGGRLANVGHYLTGIRVSATDIYVRWGYSFDAKSEMETIANSGKTSDPVANATFRVDYNAKNIFKAYSGSQTFYVTGNGEIQVLGENNEERGSDGESN